ncbi:uncharacterized protein BDW47DRAFT_97772 [Aspergillus candidus]|uniref:YMC020W-like alpha/beta hydrolase domain-containing protein n=1 Tax=Aspergillus candidus TaxID=41067 RepID=A0A2I2FN43_ASPCN|nr:hypothetical protein BDW47DRAFT_97772 [Aspergillus candidus]PLB42052.1 hypothetical protein BDW47DRAFT_97772 [Aspergillus candidus]
MAPAGPRKRVKLTPPGAAEQSGPSANDGAAGRSPHRERSGSQRQGTTGVNWYPVVWPAASRSSKAAPVTEVARESISADHNHTPSNTPSASTRKGVSPKPNRHLPYQLTRKAGASSRSLPATTTTTRINIASDGSASTPELKTDPDCATTETPDKEEPADKRENAQSDAQHEVNPTAETSDVNVSSEGGEQPSAPTAPAQPSGWFSWFYGPSPSDNATQENSVTTEDPPAKDSQPAPAESDPKEEEGADKTSSGQDPAGQDATPEVSEILGNSQKRSWLQMWYGTSSTKGLDEAPSQAPSQAASQTPSQAPSVAPTEHPNAPEESATAAENAPASINHDLNKSDLSDGSATSNRNSKSSGWSLWFRESSKDTKNAGTDTPPPQAVEATMNQDSSIQTAKLDTESEPEQKAAVAKKGGVKLKSLKSSSSSALPDKITPVDTAPAIPVPSAPETGASKQLQKALTNQVLPLFKDTYPWQERPSLIQTIGRFLHYSKAPDNSHAYAIRDPPRIKRALAIGVHGYFPAPLIRSVLGQPTGTSIRFSNMAADSIRKWTEDHGYQCDIEKIALEGEGRIAERVDLLWKLLLNWMEEIRNADFILVASHSQGVPVAIILVAKLIAFGCLNAARVGICAMAGVNLGPFADYRSRWISGSAGELFEFALPYSQVSKDYESALRNCLNFGVRISYVGSIDDQLVSLESSLFSPVTHPYVYRAVFVDGKVHAPSFLSHLVGFALKLRNLGIPDHGLIRELSSPLAGSLYSGDGHSRLYDEEAVYRLAIEFALETSSVTNATLHIKRSHPASAANPYILPFAMRGLLEEEYVRRELYDETTELLRQFDDWKPTTKVLKDVKFRLEGIRSKL